MPAGILHAAFFASALGTRPAGVDPLPSPLRQPLLLCSITCLLLLPSTQCLRPLLPLPALRLPPAHRHLQSPRACCLPAAACCCRHGGRWIRVRSPHPGCTGSTHRAHPGGCCTNGGHPRSRAHFGGSLSHVISGEKPNASHMCARIKLHTYDRQKSVIS
jgi:hypothetical protein